MLYDFDILLCHAYITPRVESVCPENDEIFDRLKVKFVFRIIRQKEN